MFFSQLKWKSSHRPEDDNIRPELLNDLRQAMGYDRASRGWYYAEYCKTLFEWELCCPFKIIYPTNNKDEYEEIYDLFNASNEEIRILVEKVNSFREAHLESVKIKSKEKL